ncbi:MAG: hypothetical protein HZB51_04610 [Chloroflexi bacterium]|nr:hypothetical protein [Chloroflexota bacterium]
MLYPINLSLLQTIKHEKTQGMMREVRIDRLVAPNEPNALVCYFRDAFHRCGHALMALGERFEHIGNPAA